MIRVKSSIGITSSLFVESRINTEPGRFQVIDPEVLFE